MSTALALAGATLGAVAFAHGVAWLALSLLALPKARAAAAGAARLRFAVIVPAHDEEASIAGTVASLLADGYEPKPEILVVADNCGDATAERAARAGAHVLTRVDAARRGKSFALDAGIARLEREPHPFDIYAVVDADTTIEPGFFAAMADAFAEGAQAAQAHYGVTPNAAPLARLRRLAFALVHYARPLGASRIGLGMGLKGNGMAFRRELVAGGIPGKGIAEDASATVALASRGVGVVFVPAAVVRGAMASGYREAGVQDRRWEGGRLALVPAALAAAGGALARGRWRAAGSALDVACLPLTLAGAAGLGSLGLATAGFGPVVIPGAGLGAILLSVFFGWIAARVPIRDLAVLVFAPRFVAHKVLTLAGLAIRGAPRTWERTRREAPP